MVKWLFFLGLHRIEKSAIPNLHMQKMRNLLILSCLTFIGLNGQAQDIYANGQSNSVTSGTCSTCGISNPDGAVDGDDNTYSTIAVNTAVSGGEAQQTYSFPLGLGQAGDTVVFLFEIPYFPSVLDDNTLIFNSFVGGVSNAEAFTTQFKSVAPSGGGKFQLLFFPNNAFDSVQVVLHVTTAATPLLGADSIYTYSVRILQSFTDPSTPDPITGCENPISEFDTIGGTCLGFCGVDNPSHILTPDPTDFTTLRVSAAIPSTSAEITGTYAGISCASDTVIIIMEDASGAMAEASFPNIRIESKLGATVVTSDTIDVNKIQRVGNLVYYTLVPGADFDAVRVVNTSGLSGTVQSLRLYQFCLRRLPPPVPTNGRIQHICYNSNLIIGSVPPSGSITRWYDASSGGTLLFTGNTFTTPVLTDTITYYLESLDTTTNCVSALRDSVVVNVYPQPVSPNVPQDTVWTCYNRTATLVPQPAGSIFNFYTDAAGTNLIGNGQFYVTDTIITDTVFYVENTYLGMCNGGVFVPVFVKVLQDPYQADIADTLIYCLNSTVSLTINEQGPGATYRWYDAGGTLVFTGNPYTNYTVSGDNALFIETVVGACTESPNRKRVDVLGVDQATITTNIMSPVYICDNDTAVGVATSASANPYLVFEWYDAFGNEVKTGNPLLVPTPNDSVSHYVTAKIGNCVSLDTAKYTVINISTVSDQDFDTTATICNGNSAVLTSNIKIPGATYTWFDKNDVQVAVGDTFVTQALTQPDVYYFEISNVTCLNGVQKHPIIISVIDPPTVSVVDNLVYACSTDMAVVEAVPNPSDAVITWWNAPSNGANLSTGNVYSFNLVTDTTLIYAEATIDQCPSTSRAAALVVNADGLLGAVSANDTICEGQVTSLSATSVINGADFSWWNSSVGGTKISTGNPFLTPTLNSTTTYFIRVEFTGQDNNVCANRGRTPVTVVVREILDQPVVTCGPASNTSLSFQWNAVPNAVRYQISLDGGVSFVDPNNALGANTHQVNGLTPDSVVTAIVRAIGTLPCQTSPNSVAVSCVATDCLPNNASLDNILVNICEDQTGTINVIDLPSNYRIQYNGQAATTNTSYSFGLTNAGEYNLDVLVYIDGQVGCDSVHLTGKFVVYPTPTVKINAIALSPSTPGQHVNTFRFEADGTGATTWSWNFGDGETANEQNPTHSYAADGNYTVSVYVTGALGCDASTTLDRLVTVSHIPDIYIPNTFTPNGDKKNDAFGVFGQNIKLEMLRIFNDYGNIVFESDDLERKWDGTYNGDPVPSGTYYYTAIVFDPLNVRYEKEGTITVIRK